ncbi:MAG: PEP-utilizing enzyme [Patescibacteria group bacterium]|nr:PEP-utilizing enzyme [Patescibacteria group bacterium]MDD5715484.1 PEP-utilizing enzyme [Patescibacteria group bacterium]
MAAQRYKRMFEVRNYMLRTEIAAWGNTLWNQKIHGFGSRDFIFLSERNKIQAFMDEADLPRIATVGYRNLTNPPFVRADLVETWRVLRRMYREISELKKLDVANVPTRQLGLFAQRYLKTLINVYGRFQTSVNWYTIGVEQELRQYLAGKVSNTVKREDVLRSLVRPVKRFEFEQEEIEWIRIVLEAQKHGAFIKKLKDIGPQRAAAVIKKKYPGLFQKIAVHQQQYEWLTADSNLQPYTVLDCVRNLQTMLHQQPRELKSKLHELESRQRTVIRENKRLLAQYRVSPTYRRLVAMLQEYAYTRFCIRFCWTQGMHFGMRLYHEAARRSKINPELSQFCLTTEIVDCLIHGKQLPAADLRKRKTLYVLWLHNFKLELYTGLKARNLVRYVREHSRVERTGEVHGEIGSPGRTVGRVKVITYDKPLAPQIDEMKKGDILVAGQTRPEIITACRKAGAIVTNEGGICSHAAVVSREFDIPCVIGTKVATDIFKDGDRVEVNANEGIVRRIK